MDATEVRRWIANFEAAAEADRQALRERGGAGVDRARSIDLSLSMIAAVRRALGGRAVDDPCATPRTSASARSGSDSALVFAGERSATTKLLEALRALPLD